MNEDIGYVSRPEDLVIYPWTAEALRLINQAGIKAIIVTNQSGVARGLYSEETLDAIHRELARELARQGARFDAVYYCPHHPEVGSDHYRMECDCRKPRPGLLHRAAREHGIDLSRSHVIGDKASDIQTAAAVGAHSVLVMTGYGRETLADPARWPCQPDLVAENLLAAVKLLL